MHPIPLGYYPFKGNWVVPTGQRKFDLGGGLNPRPVGFEPTTSGLDLPMLYRLSYEASTG